MGGGPSSGSGRCVLVHRKSLCWILGITWRRALAGYLPSRMRRLPTWAWSCSHAGFSLGREGRSALTPPHSPGLRLLWCRSYSCRLVHLEQVFNSSTGQVFKIYVGVTSCVHLAVGSWCAAPALAFELWATPLMDGGILGADELSGSTWGVHRLRSCAQTRAEQSGTCKGGKTALPSPSLCHSPMWPQLYGIRLSALR